MTQFFNRNSKKEIRMVIQELESHWPDLSGKLQNRFTKLTSIDLHFIKGKEEDLFTRIQSRLNKTREEVITLIDSL